MWATIPKVWLSIQKVKLLSLINVNFNFVDLNYNSRSVNFIVSSHTSHAFEQCTVKWFTKSHFFTNYTPHYQCNNGHHDLFQIILLHILNVNIFKNTYHSNIILWDTKINVQYIHACIIKNSQRVNVQNGSM